MLSLRPLFYGDGPLTLEDTPRKAPKDIFKDNVEGAPERYLLNIPFNYI